MVFFQPTNEFVQWLKEYAGDRVVVEIGCGDGLLIAKMNEAEMKCIGVDLYYPFNIETEIEVPKSMNILYGFAGEDCELIKDKRSLIVIARPCHDGFPSRVAKNKAEGVEMLYVGLERNIDEDLYGKLTHTKIELPFKVGKEDEVVLSLK